MRSLALQCQHVHILARSPSLAPIPAGTFTTLINIITSIVSVASVPTRPSIPLPTLPRIIADTDAVIAIVVTVGARSSLVLPIRRAHTITPTALASCPLSGLNIHHSPKQHRLHLRILSGGDREESCVCIGLTTRLCTCTCICTCTCTCTCMIDYSCTHENEQNERRDRQGGGDGGRTRR